MLRDLPVEARRNFLKRLPGSLAHGLRALGQGFLAPASPPGAGVLKARLEVAQCLAWGGMDCQQCYLACPLRDQALRMIDAKPVLAAQLCNGCAQCETACRTVNDRPAVRMIPSV
ncbi:MAG: hypothetical protein HY714_01095 [Candidatus Omnitrophica bacterium]|nr:hypothetical protein [Candidatus Omnitrophota bacterium]